MNKYDYFLLFSLMLVLHEGVHLFFIVFFDSKITGIQFFTYSWGNPSANHLFCINHVFTTVEHEMILFLTPLCLPPLFSLVTRNKWFLAGIAFSYSDVVYCAGLLF